MKRTILQIFSWVSFFALIDGMLFRWVPADKTSWTALALFFVIAVFASYPAVKK